MKLEQIVKRMQRISDSELARVTGLGRVTIREIRTGETQNPGVRTVATIAAGLERIREIKKGEKT